MGKIMASWTKVFGPLPRVRRCLEVFGVAILAAGLITAPLVGAYAKSNHDDPFENHFTHVASPEDNHHTDYDHHDLGAPPNDDAVSDSTTDDLCCEDIGFCYVGFILSQVERTSFSLQISSYGQPGDSTPWLNHLCLPDGPPPRS